MDKLVDTTVNLVEEGKLQQAVEVLQQGITLLSSSYPGRFAPGLGIGSEASKPDMHPDMHAPWQLCDVTLPARWSNQQHGGNSATSARSDCQSTAVNRCELNTNNRTQKEGLHGPARTVASK
jgi:hypothetical protein